MKNLYYLVIAVILFTISCKKTTISPLGINTENKTYDITVEGGVNTFQKQQFIKLSTPAIIPNKIIKPISKAIVSVSDGFNKVYFKETDTPGVYSGIINDNKNYGKQYFLYVDYNKLHYVASDTLTRVEPIKDSDLPFFAQVISNGKIQLKIPKHTFGSIESLRWLIVYPGRNQWDPSVFKKVAYNYSHQPGTPNTLYPSIQKITTTVLNPSDTVTVYKFSLSASYSTYLYDLFQETDFKNIFSSTPGSISGNISNDGLGYFHATDVTVKQYLAKDLIK